MGEIIVGLIVLFLAWLVFKSIWAIILFGLAFLIVLAVIDRVRARL